MDNRRLGCSSLMRLLYLFYLLPLLAGAAAMAMPVTYALDQDVLAHGQPQGPELVQLGQWSSQPLKPDAGLVLMANNPLLGDLAKQPGAEFEAALAVVERPAASASLQGSGLRPNSRAEQELFGGGAKDMLISAEVKHVLKELRGELHQLTGDHFARAQADGAAEQAKLTRRLDEARSAQNEATGWRASVSDDERRQGAWRVALMTEQLLDEITPWAITAAVLFGLFHLTRALMRKQAMARLLRSKDNGPVTRPAALAAAPAQALPGENRPLRGKPQRIRLTSASSSSRSRRKLF